jgi:hypothetical protein
VLLDSHEDAGWDAECRRIGTKFIVDVLTSPQWRDEMKRHGMRLRGARIDGDLDLVNAEIGTELWIGASRIEGNLDLTGAHLVRPLTLERTRVHGNFTAEQLRADSDVELTGSIFEQKFDISNILVKGDLYLRGSDPLKKDVFKGMCLRRK